MNPLCCYRYRDWATPPGVPGIQHWEGGLPYSWWDQWETQGNHHSVLHGCAARLASSTLMYIIHSVLYGCSTRLASLFIYIVLHTFTCTYIITVLVVECTVEFIHINCYNHSPLCTVLLGHRL